MSKSMNELIMEFFMHHPNQELRHGPVVDWVTGVMPLKKAQNSLDTGIPEVAEEEWEKDPVMQAAMRDARGAYRRGEYRTFDEYVADRRRRSR